MRLALAQLDTGWHDPAAFLQQATRSVAGAAADGAELVVFPEMANTGFTMAAEEFAEPMNGATVTGIASLAAAHRVEELLGIPTRRDGRHFNSAVHIGSDGIVKQLYDKRSLFTYADEHHYYAAGDSMIVSDTAGVRWSPLICYDLRKPELFREVGPFVDLIIVIANWPVNRRSHWEKLLPARAIENQVFVAAVNRAGVGGGLSYDGGSIILDPWGETISLFGSSSETRAVDIDAQRVSEIRTKFPFTTDRRGERVGNE